MTAQFSLRLSLLIGLATGSHAALDGSRYLWYSGPATDWETGALPIGCGRLGATVWGGGNEVLTINEDTIWSGPFQDRTPKNGLAALPVIREMLLEGNITAAGTKTISDMGTVQSAERAFSYFGNLNLAFGHNNMADYERWLDTKQGNSGVSYTSGGVDYTREYIASFPASVLAGRITASKDGSLSLNATISRSENIIANAASTANGLNTVTMMGSSGQAASSNPILYTGQARFVAPGATFAASGGTLRITGATTIDVFFDAETNYRYDTQAEWEAEIDEKLSAAVDQGFEKIKADAIADAAALLDRASLDLGDSPNGMADLPTDQRVTTARKGLSDIQLVTLVWNYGRHLLVASSRDTEADVDLPANLQGVWNNATNAPWGGKYTININTEMNYWSAGQTNLIETQRPLFDLMKVAEPRGQAMARDLYGCGGVVFHHNLDAWGDAAPVDNWPSSTMWPMGAAWLVQHMMDQYRFTGDRDFLENTAYPFLTQVAAFYQCYTFEYEGNMVTGPSLSPENSFIVPANMSVAGQGASMDIAPEMDNQLMRDVMNDVLEAAEALGIADTDDDVVAAKAFLPLIREPRIGSGGQLLEWRFEYKEQEPSHRHLSPMYGMHPGFQMSPLVNATLSQASKVLLDHRVSSGSGSTGWSRTWILNQYARLHSGADVWKHVVAWFARYPTGNLWNTDSGRTFQIDGNWGMTSGLTEMLLQSHDGLVHILPALPADAVPTGSAKGLMARGGFEVDSEWADGSFKTATVTSKLGNKMSLRVGDGGDISVNGKLYTGPIQTTKGEKYVITPGKPACEPRSKKRAVSF